MSEYISVTILNNYLKNIVDAEEMLHNICVVGEISQFKTSGNHAYFTMKDDNAEISCTLFNYRMSEYLPKHGETVLATGSIDYYVKGGRLSFKVRKLAPLGAGAIALRLEALKKKLTAEGYFDESHKKPIPVFSERVCVLTAKTGAVIRDIISTARKNNSFLDIDLYPVKVQGEGSQNTIIDALKKVDTMGYDAIIIARGGGSFEDLMGFNDEKLVYAIFEAKTPIISAVGHETDFTLCDFVADKRVPTPTAAAELVAFNMADLLSGLLSTIDGMRGCIQRKHESLKNSCLHASRRIVAGGKLIIMRNRNNITSIANRLGGMLNAKFTVIKLTANSALNRIEQNNPMKILRQGYAKAYKSGVPIDDAVIVVGDELDVITASKKIKAEITDIENYALGENK